MGKSTVFGGGIFSHFCGDFLDSWSSCENLIKTKRGVDENQSEVVSSMPSRELKVTWL